MTPLLLIGWLNTRGADVCTARDIEASQHPCVHDARPVMPSSWADVQSGQPGVSCLNQICGMFGQADMWELWDMTQFLWSTFSLSCHLVQLIIRGRLGSGKAAQLVVYLNLNLRRADFSSVCYIWRVCMSARLPNMSGLDGLASVQPSHAKSERLSEALIRGKDGQSCRFPFPT